MPEEVVDLLVLGCGAAGMAAALRAAELGASAVVVEKQTRAAHTPGLRMSGGHVMAVADAEQGAAYLDRCAAGMIPSDVTRAWAQRAVGLVEWLHAHEPELQLERVYGAEHPDFDGAGAIDVHWQSRLKDGTRLDSPERISSGDAQGAVPAFNRELRAGPAFYDALLAAVERQPGVRIDWGSGASRLLRDDGGRVTGAQLASGAAARAIRARHGVVLATGGYEFDDELKLDSLKASPIHFYGNPANTGDGVRMAQAVGADLWHMNQMVGRAVGHFELDDGRPLNVPVSLTPGAYVLLDRDGARFANEWAQARRRHDFYYELLVYDTARGGYPRIPCYWIFDATRFGEPLTSSMLGATAVGLYDWSPDNSREVQRGWIAAGETVEQVARQLGIEDPDAAAASVAGFNDACAAGHDPLGRPADSLDPLVGPPYYGVALYPGGANTSGGPRRDASARIVDPFGEPIAGLFGAGELGQAIGHLYPAGGCNLSEAFCFGQIAVETALSASPVAAP